MAASATRPGGCDDQAGGAAKRQVDGDAEIAAEAGRPAGGVDAWTRGRVVACERTEAAADRWPAVVHRRKPAAAKRMRGGGTLINGDCPYLLRYTHDAWNRLVKVEFEQDATPPHAPRGEYEYNGLNWRTIRRADTRPADSTHALDQKRLLYYGPEWQLLEERIDESYQSSPGVNRHAQYVWGLRYIDDIVATRQNHNPIGGGGPQLVAFHLTDAQFSTVALVSQVGALLERVAYTAYGVARQQPSADVTGEGAVDGADLGVLLTAFDAAIGDPEYRSEADLNLDGVIDGADYGLVLSGFTATPLADGVLSSPLVDNHVGYCGYVFAPETQSYLVRHRWYLPLGRWIQRDLAEYVDGMNLYEFVASAPVTRVDPLGLDGVEIRQRMYERRMLGLDSAPPSTPGRKACCPITLEFLEQPIQSDSAIESERIRRPRSLRVSSISELVFKALAEVASCESSSGRCCCIEDLVINGHGAGGQQSIGAGRMPLDAHCRLLSEEVLFSELRSGVIASNVALLGPLSSRMCTRARVRFLGCHVGRGYNGNNLLQEVADVLGTDGSYVTAEGWDVLVCGDRPCPGEKPATLERRHTAEGSYIGRLGRDCCEDHPNEP